MPPASQGQPPPASQHERPPASTRAMLPALLRDDFPALQRSGLVYLDSAATSQKPRAVLDAVRRHYERHNANAHRGIYRLAEEATAALDEAREAVRAFLHAGSAGQIVFTRGSTDGINLVAQGWARPRLRPGDELVVTELEHHSNLLPWQRVAAQTGAVLRIVRVGDDGALPDPVAALEAQLSRRTRLVAFTHVSNALGTLLPAAELAKAAHRVGAAVLVDAAQSAPHLPLDVGALGCDFLVFSAHKLLGPTGVGVLCGTPERLEEIEPVTLGGGMVGEVSLEGATWAPLPRRLEAGTQPVAEIVGLAAAIAYLSALGMDRVREHERALTAHALSRLASVPGLSLYGPPADQRSGVVSFNLRGVHAHDLAAALDARGIAVRAGNHCAQPLMRRLGLAGTARASFHVYTQPAEIDALAEALEGARGISEESP